MTLIRIAERDFYLAYYTLDRIEEIPQEIEYLYHLKKFLEGAVNMIKKKYKAGIEALESFDSTKVPEEDVIQLTKSFLAFGHFNLGQIDKALEIYKVLETEGKITEGDSYNKEICTGILCGESDDFSQAEKHFKKAQTMNKIKVEPAFY
jgi:tetratricopeptide (TPR) repeat protein